MNRLALVSLLAVTLLNSGCATISGIGTDNNPKPSALVKFTPEAAVKQLWSVKTGKGNADNYLRLSPAYLNGIVYTADANGNVTATRATTGQQVWATDTKTRITGSVAAASDIVVAGTQEGQIIALDAQTGKQRWRTTVPGQVLAAPAITEQMVIVKTLDGNLSALDIKSGQALWTVAHPTPPLLLRGSSAPQLAGKLVIAGYADGRLAAYELASGKQRWERAIAIPQGNSIVARMIDIDVDPVIDNDTVYVATYQGNIAALNVQSGEQIWEHPISSYAGMTLDQYAVYITDADSNVLAFERKSGHILWKQTRLYARRITGPVKMDNAIAVADQEGYLHWLATEDGHFISRTQVDKNGITANPFVVNNVLYVTTTNGYLAAYALIKK